MSRFRDNAGPLTRLRPSKINFYLKVMRERGHDAAQVLAGTGIDPRQLEEPRYLVEISDYIRIIANINRLAGSPSLAFDLGEHLTLGDLGILGYCVMSCKDTDEATRLWHQYNPLFFGNLIEMEIEPIGRQLLLSYLPYADIREDLLQFLIEEKICCDVALQRLIGMEQFPAARLTLMYPPPPHAARYTELIPCPVQFSAKRSAMLLRDDALAIPLRGHDPETHAHCLKLLNEVFDGIDSSATMSRKVSAILYDNLHMGIAETAARLCCTTRTLSRRLAKENLNFSEVSSATRLELIKNLLATTHLESKALADRAGFADVRSLRRFFKAKTGKTLQQFRRETSGHAG